MIFILKSTKNIQQNKTQLKILKILHSIQLCNSKFFAVKVFTKTKFKNQFYLCKP